ncbi:unnamed protein product [Periconia digitata]|uniref:Uncharacterized protein n=1 Tax=Periconia digitata TaxID=1303443 RepID=A0A9W4UU69_9PLEO|nr:unnamed protein product [Periconia digitata]
MDSAPGVVLGKRQGCPFKDKVVHSQPHVSRQPRQLDAFISTMPDKPLHGDDFVHTLHR